MITFIILIALVSLGVYLISKFEYEPYGVILLIVSGVWLIIHSICFGTSTYEYEQFITQRDAFEATLNSSRNSGNSYETAAIVSDVSEWNIKLSEMKYDNKTLMLGQYVDDRIELLEPIK